MLREERDGAFWQAVAEHPAVAPSIFLGGQHMEFAAVVDHPSVTPLAAQHGGYLLYQLDGLGRVYELHALFTPEGWGREATAALRAVNEDMRGRGAELLIAHEVDGNWRSRPPRSHGWLSAGGFAPSPLGNLRTWTLRMADWLQSPAFRRMTSCRH